MNINQQHQNRILLIAPHGSYRTFAFINAARQKGIEVLIASEGKHSVVSAYSEGLHIKFDEPDLAIKKMLHEASKNPFTAVIGTDDSTTELAAKVSKILGLEHNEPMSVEIAKRKDLARTCLRDADVKIPNFVIINIAQDSVEQISNIKFPVVVKPIGLSGSLGVIRVDDEQALEKTCRRVATIIRQDKKLSAENYQYLLLEEFIAGDEIAVEGILIDEKFTLLSIFDKPDPLNGPYFEETYYITPSKLTESQQQELIATLQSACDAYGLRHGPIHAECRINEDGIWVIEIAARTIGGLCGRLLQFGTGLSLEELVLAHAIGESIPTIEQLPHDKASGVLMIPIPKHGILKRVEGLLAAQNIPLIDDVSIQIQEGYEVIPLPDNSSYLGFIFASGSSTQEVEQALRKAHECLNIIIAPLLFKANVA
ncbi:MAG: ATP-grasp domain-containing protein [Gammaproteobacteria bacterium]